MREQPQSNNETGPDYIIAMSVLHTETGSEWAISIDGNGHAEFPENMTIGQLVILSAFLSKNFTASSDRFEDDLWKKSFGSCDFMRATGWQWLPAQMSAWGYKHDA